jgi:hypothetical protein
MKLKKRNYTVITSEIFRENFSGNPKHVFMEYHQILNIIWCYKHVNTYRGHNKLDPPLEWGGGGEETDRTEKMVRKQNFM